MRTLTPYGLERRADGHTPRVLPSGLELAPRRALFNTPLHPYTEALLSAVPVPDPDPANKRVRIILPGDVPSPVNPPAGCRFHTRCPYVFARCRTESPVLRELAPGHHVACHLL